LICAQASTLIALTPQSAAQAKIDRKNTVVSVSGMSVNAATRAEVGSDVTRHITDFEDGH